ncbi:oligopeptide transporter ATP-binding component [compost metagenome]
MPRLDGHGDGALHAIPGNPPNLQMLPEGCSFRARCAQAFEACVRHPELLELPDGHRNRCHLEQAE